MGIDARYWSTSPRISASFACADRSMISAKCPAVFIVLTLSVPEEAVQRLERQLGPQAIGQMRRDMSGEETRRVFPRIPYLDDPPARFHRMRHVHDETRRPRQRVARAGEHPIIPLRRLSAYLGNHHYRHGSLHCFAGTARSQMQRDEYSDMISAI